MRAPGERARRLGSLRRMDDVQRLADAGRRGVTVAVAESLTSGLLAAAVGDGEHASTWFAGGVVAYRTGVKEDLLGLTPGTDPCSAACAVQLASGVRRLFAVDVAVATTGVGGPDPQNGHPPGTVYLGWASASGTGHLRLQLAGDPASVVRQTVRSALELLADRAAEQLENSPGTT